MNPPLASLLPGMGSPHRRSPSNDPDLRHRAQFATLYHAYVGFVRRVVRQAGIRADDVADVVQDVFVILDREICRGLDTSGSLYGWLKLTAYRKARDFKELAYNREQPSRGGAIDLPATDPSPEESMQKVDLDENVLAVLEQLPHELRLVLVMSDVSDMPMREIADVLEIPKGTGDTRLRAARMAFKRRWDERRASGMVAVAPFASWDAPSVLEWMRTNDPESPPGFEDEVWTRLVDSLGWSGAAAVAGGTVAGAAKAGVMLTAKQIAAGVIASAIVGAGVYAVARKALDAPKSEPKAVAVMAVRDDGQALGHASAFASSAAPVASVARAPSSSPTATTTSTAATTAAPSAIASSHSTVASERMWLDTARAKLDQGDLQGARAALAHVTSERFRRERDELQRAVLAYQDGGP